MIDIDPDDFSLDAQPMWALEKVIMAMNQLLGLDLDPAIIDSGRGVQAWITFPEVSPAPDWAPAATRALLKAVEETVGANIHDCHVDRSVADLTRLARAPGSVNQRTGRRCAVLHMGSPSMQFAEALTAWKPRVPEPRPSQTPLVVTRTWASALTYIPQLMAVTFLTEGASRGGRHHAACNAAYALRECGVPETEVLDGLLYGGRLCEPPLEEPEVVRLWTTTRRAP